MRIHLIRHGQTEMNAIHTIDTGYPGSDLTEIGKEQARNLVARMDGAPVDAIFVSNLVRTHQTASPLATARAIRPLQLDGLREIEAGDLEHEDSEDAYRTYYGTVVHWLDGELDERMMGASSGREVLDRYDEAIREIERSGAQSVAIFSHGGVISYWAGMRVTGLTRHHLLERHLTNTAMCVMEGSLDSGYHALSWMGEEIS